MISLSILVPCYNTSQYLKQCLDSLVNQTLSSCEFICVNDGSTDNTLEILHDYASKDSRFIIIDKENGGYGKAMNIALEHAKGKYIGIVEPDDYVALDMFETLYEAAEKNNLDFIKSDFNRFIENEYTGKIDFVYNSLSKNIEDYNIVFDPQKKLESFNFIMNIWSGIYKRDFIENYKINFNETPGASFQDNGFYFQTFAFANQVMILNKAFYFNRRDNPNSSVKNSQKVYALNFEYDWIQKKLENNSDIWNRVKGYYWVKRFDNYDFTLKRIADEFKSEYVRFLACEVKNAFENHDINLDLLSDFHKENLYYLLNNSKFLLDKYFILLITDEKYGYLKYGNAVIRKIKNAFLVVKNFGFINFLKFNIKRRNLSRIKKNRHFLTFEVF